MSVQFREPQDWSSIITQAYVSGTKPPLTEELAGRVRDAVLAASNEGAWTDASQSDDIARINGALDEFEQDLNAVSGPRLVSADTVSGAVEMRHRSEADHPLRAFGGQ